MRSTLQPSELGLFLQAVRLGLLVQPIRRGASLETVRDRLLAIGVSPRRVDPEAAIRAAGRAGRVLGALGLLNSCLTRTLVAGALLADCEGVFLHLGFRGDDRERQPLAGHAWLTCRGRVVPSPEAAASASGESYEEVAALPMQRPR